jgi:hypothetical protein
MVTTWMGHDRKPTLAQIPCPSPKRRSLGHSADAERALDDPEMHANQESPHLGTNVAVGLASRATAACHGAQSLLNKYDEFPSSLDTDIKANTAGATAAAQAFVRLLASINGRTVTTYIRTVTEVETIYAADPNAGGAGRVSGHGELRKFYGGIESFRAGGILHTAAGGGPLPSSATIAPNGADLVNWAESGTGGEAFILLGSYNRTRLIQVSEETGRRLGVAGSGSASSLKGISIFGTLDTPRGRVRSALSCGTRSGPMPPVRGSRPDRPPASSGGRHEHPLA